jgi:hypothetical protein
MVSFGSREQHRTAISKFENCLELRGLEIRDLETHLENRDKNQDESAPTTDIGIIVEKCNAESSN